MMNRRTFLKSIVAVIAAPFLAKVVTAAPKASPKRLGDVMREYKAKLATASPENDGGFLVPQKFADELMSDNRYWVSNAYPIEHGAMTLNDVRAANVRNLPDSLYMPKSMHDFPPEVVAKFHAALRESFVKAGNAPWAKWPLA